MLRQRPRLDERMLFAILLIEFGIIIPFLAASWSPASVEPMQPAAGSLDMAQGRGRPPSAEGPQKIDQRPVLIVPASAADVGQPLGVQNAPTATLGVLPAEAAPPPPRATITNTPEPLAAVLGPVDGASAAPTLFPTLVGADVPLDMVMGQPPPILMYHYIRSVDQGSDPLGYELSLAPELFEAQMAWLHEQGYRTMRMDMVARCIASGACPARAVALTFDDGYADAFTTALPVLQRYGFTATFYIVSGLVGQPGYMSWEQLVALRDAGMEIGAHTIDHYDLTTLDPAESERQILQSKTDLEHRLGIGVTSFCYPVGLYNWSVAEQARAAGYLSAATTRWDDDYGDLMALPRRRISGGMGVDSIAAIVQGY
jgi:peptidoglycan/xylan/chitin deacetylase (PgdA/CDA1 family)